MKIADQSVAHAPSNLRKLCAIVKSKAKIGATKAVPKAPPCLVCEPDEDLDKKLVAKPLKKKVDPKHPIDVDEE